MITLELAELSSGHEKALSLPVLAPSATLRPLVGSWACLSNTEPFTAHAQSHRVPAELHVPVASLDPPGPIVTRKEAVRHALSYAP